jgi:hypothetical protein
VLNARSNLRATKARLFPSNSLSTAQNPQFDVWRLERDINQFCLRLLLTFLSLATQESDTPQDAPAEKHSLRR